MPSKTLYFWIHLQNYPGAKCWTAQKTPPTFACNPVNYAKLNKLTTAEAISGALDIMGFHKQARLILGGQKWGHTFFDLNASLLDDYAKLCPGDDLLTILEQYGIKDMPV